ncbi:MAG TPA: hypothetical protein PKG48_08660 [Bacteroidales bacterium]|nr:hypothetical protein [Bacteroidales bacterium]HPS61579.1 hypothetical protein [Bacteroidales bacterium]
MKRLLLLLPALFFLVAGNGQTIDRIEYFFDTDPGFGLATPVGFSTGSSVTAGFTLNTSALPAGIHMLHVRARNTDRKWSLLSSKMILVPEPGPGIPVTGLEYYIDNDPGFGNAAQVPVTGGISVPAWFEVNTIGLEKGLHILCTRTRDSQGRWSTLSSTLFFLEDVDPGTPIGRMEFFLDHDPGFKAATPVPVTPGTTVAASFTINPDTLLPGMHLVGLRVKDEKQRWSVLSVCPYVFLPEAPGRVITAMEYFIDNDPGYGAGRPVTINPSPEISALFIPDLSTAGNGLHLLCVRAKNAGGVWSVLQSYVFFQATEEKSPLTRLEYYFDTDPGFGSGTEVPIHPSHAVTATFSPDLTGISQGTHSFIVRARDAAGRWSIAMDTACVNTGVTRNWTGAVSDEWNLAENWAPEGVPAADDDVIIPPSAPFMPVVRINGLNCRTLNVLPGGRLQVNPGIVLTVNGSCLLKNTPD